MQHQIKQWRSKLPRDGSAASAFVTSAKTMQTLSLLESLSIKKVGLMKHDDRTAMLESILEFGCEVPDKLIRYLVELDVDKLVQTGDLAKSDTIAMLCIPWRAGFGGEEAFSPAAPRLTQLSFETEEREKIMIDMFTRQVLVKLLVEGTEKIPAVQSLCSSMFKQIDMHCGNDLSVHVQELKAMLYATRCISVTDGAIIEAEDLAPTDDVFSILKYNGTSIGVRAMSDAIDTDEDWKALKAEYSQKGWRSALSSLTWTMWTQR